MSQTALKVTKFVLELEGPDGEKFEIEPHGPMWLDGVEPIINDLDEGWPLGIRLTSVVQAVLLTIRMLQSEEDGRIYTFRRTNG